MQIRLNLPPETQNSQRVRPMYGDHWRSIDDPRHQRWLRRLDELGVLETPTAEA